MEQELDCLLKIFLMGIKIFIYHVLGNHSIGKTCLLLTYSDKNYLDLGIYTPQGKELIDFSSIYLVLDTYRIEKVIGDKTVRIHIWDTEDRENQLNPYNKYNLNSYVSSNVIILCYDCTDRNTLTEIENFWVPEIRIKSDKPIVLCGTKQDLVDNNSEDHVTLEEANIVAENIKASSNVQCSSLRQIIENDGNVTRVFEIAINIAYDYQMELILRNEQRNIKACCNIF